MHAVLVEKDVYFDSVLLMRLSSQMQQLPGVLEGVIALGTDMHKSALVERGFPAAELALAGAHDLLIAVEAESQSACDMALTQAKNSIQTLHRQHDQGVGALTTLRAAVQAQPQANLALISVPGVYAAREAAVALELGLHVMLFSDNVTVEDEVALKRLAVARGLLLMGPDCGTAIINGKPLGFANQVRRGDIGIVGASGTGIQEVTCLIDALGGGISQAIGTGGRDLQDPRIGGLMTLQGIAALAADPLTEVLVIIAKPPYPRLAKTVLRRLQGIEKPAVVHFLGMTPGRARGRVQFAASLVQTAELAVACSQPAERAVLPWAEQLDMATLARREAAQMAPQQRFLRGLYTGGTLADEALFLLDGKIGPVYSNIHVNSQRLLADPQRSLGHSVVDLGDDSFTRGRPHPMLEPALRAARICQEGEDPELGLLLFDLVLGYGAHDDPAGAMVAAIAEVRAAAMSRGGYLPVLASITGTPADPQNRQAQQEKLQQAGCLVLPSNYHAVQAALAIAQEAWGGGKAARTAKRGRRS